MPASPRLFQHLVDEQTPGGLNEDAVRRLTANGHYTSFTDVLDAILKRIEEATKPAVASYEVDLESEEEFNAVDAVANAMKLYNEVIETVVSPVKGIRNKLIENVKSMSEENSTRK